MFLKRIRSINKHSILSEKAALMTHSNYHLTDFYGYHFMPKADFLETNKLFFLLFAIPMLCIIRDFKAGFFIFTTEQKINGY